MQLEGRIGSLHGRQQIVVGGGVEAAGQVTASISLLQAFQPVIIYAYLAGYKFFILKK